MRLLVLFLALSVAQPSGLWAGEATSGADAPAAEMGQAAKAQFELGLELARKKNYSAASRAFAAAYEQEPNLDILFAWAQAERLAGNCAHARDLYRRFLSEPLAAEQKQAGEIGLRRCAQEPRMADEKPSNSKRGAQWIGGTLVGFGAVSAGVGLGVVAVSVAQERSAPSADSYTEYRARMENAQNRRILGIGVAGAGLLSAALGAAWWIYLRPSSGGAEAAAWSTNISSEGLSVAVRGAF